MHSYLITGLRAGPFFRLLRKHGFSLSVRNIGGLIFAMQNAFWASFFTWRERNKYSKKIASWPVPEDPVIIVGHWRTGSTFLHLLLSQDRQFVAPTLFQAAFPDCFLAAEKFYRPVMGRIVNTRPMDNVRLKFDDAQEDEFALLKLTIDSPLLDVVFPKKKGYFLLNYEDFNPSTEKKTLWREKLQHFSRRVAQDSKRTLLLKNPLHSARIPFLLEVFPNARFIHIHRHPYNVVASSRNLWRIMADDNQLKGKPYHPTLDEVTKGLKLFYEVLERDLEVVPKERKCTVSYEDLDKDPAGVIRRIFNELGFVYNEGTEKGITSFLEGEKEFRKNSYTFGEEEKELVYGEMKDIFDRYHYAREL